MSVGTRIGVAVGWLFGAWVGVGVNVGLFIMLTGLFDAESPQDAGCVPTRK